uniref:Uncharacterized protein n=1 Tax=Ascaris lumbricoides TaxID=6252 RepID=A0A0M3I1J3_ASCLU
MPWIALVPTVIMLDVMYRATLITTPPNKIHHCSENGIGVNGQVITSEFDKPYQAPFQQSTNHFYEARMLPKSNNYADDLLLIDIVEQNHTSSPNQIDGFDLKD